MGIKENTTWNFGNYFGHPLKAECMHANVLTFDGTRHPIWFTQCRLGVIVRAIPSPAAWIIFREQTDHFQIWFHRHRDLANTFKRRDFTQLYDIWWGPNCEHEIDLSFIIRKSKLVFEFIKFVCVLNNFKLLVGVTIPVLANGDQQARPAATTTWLAHHHQNSFTFRKSRWSKWLI